MGTCESEKKKTAGRGVVDRAEDERRHHGRHGHRRDAEQILPRHPEEKDREIHLGRIELVCRHLEAPGHPARVGEQQEHRHHGERE